MFSTTWSIFDTSGMSKGVLSYWSSCWYSQLCKRRCVAWACTYWYLGVALQRTNLPKVYVPSEGSQHPMTDERLCFHVWCVITASQLPTGLVEIVNGFALRLDFSFSPIPLLSPHPLPQVLLPREFPNKCATCKTISDSQNTQCRTPML
jgi:hypothetical protein